MKTKVERVGLASGSRRRMTLEVAVLEIATKVSADLFPSRMDIAAALVRDGYIFTRWHQYRVLPIRSAR